MQKIKCIISYDGTNFSGFQHQPNKRTVQREVERAIWFIHRGKKTKIYSSGRTDAGVHAKGQVFHFESEMSIPPPNWRNAINGLLPEDIFVNEVELVPQSFHARYSASEKEYRYIVLNSKERDAFKRNYMHFFPFTIDLNKIEAASALFEGTHDFTSFCSTRSTVKGSKIRTLHYVGCQRYGDELHFTLRGDGFLYNMARIIVGVLLDVGSGRIKCSEIEEMFRKKDRKIVGKTLPPEGLYLWEVTYEKRDV